MSLPAIENAEHIDPATTGDNIAAKKVASYGWNGATWGRQPLSGAGFVTSAYDYVGVDNSGSTTKIFTFKTGGSGGTTVNTVTLNYADSTKANLTSVVRT
jgi:hypothetical protein